MTDFPDPASVPIRPAATVLMLRDAADGGVGVEVFMLRRTSSAVFAAGMYVFPGGRVDDVDHADEIAPYCVGLDDAQASRRLGIESGGLAYWVAAVRECFEEAGILLATHRDGGRPQVGDDDRHAVHDGTLSMVELCRRHDLVLDLSTTHYVDHWITPEGESRRFDTRFFVTEARADQEGAHDDKETVDSLWVRPATALEQVAAGELMMMPPTVANLRSLVPHAQLVDAMVAAASVTDVVCTLPKMRRDADGRIVGIAMPGDADY